MLALSTAHSDLLWTILSALGVILTVLATHLRARNDRNTKQEETTARIETVQKTVNGTTHSLTNRVNQLDDALTAAGVSVPAVPSQLLANASDEQLQAELDARKARA